MGKDNSTSPRWMDAWLQLEVYESRRKCRKHVNRYETRFCSVCMGEPICEPCWNESTEHEGHQFLQVYAASRRTGILVGEIAKFWDASDIQRYRINHKYVVYLKPSPEGTQETDQIAKCETCNRKLMESKNRFCSIACKKTSIEASQPLVERKSIRKDIEASQPLVERKPKREDIEASKPLVERKPKRKDIEPSQPLVVRKHKRQVILRTHRRKGIPRRSPLF